MQNILNVSCGLDVHKDTIEACILTVTSHGEPNVSRETFTTKRGDLIKLRDWLTDSGCPNIAMESTGVFWRPIYEILEETVGVNLCLVNARHMKNLPGRKTDVNDAEWIASLFMCGLLDKSYVPEKGIRDLREYTRFHVKLTQDRVRLLNRLEKFLQTHGFKLSSVLSSISGVSGIRILEKLAAYGEVCAFDVRSCLAGGVKKSAEEIAYAINGKLSPASRLLLRLLLDTLYSLDSRLAALYKGMCEIAEPYRNAIELLDGIPGIDVLSGIYIIAEIGADMSAFAGDGNLVSWAGLSPKNDMSAGVVYSKSLKKGNRHIKPVLCQCAWGAVKKRNTRLSNWFWRNVKRLGEKKAIMAVARKILCYAYHLLKTGVAYDNSLDEIDTDKNNAYKLESAKQKVAKLEGKSAISKISKKVETVCKVINDMNEPNQEINQGIKSPISNPGNPDPNGLPKKRGRPKKELQVTT